MSDSENENWGCTVYACRLVPGDAVRTYFKASLVLSPSAKNLRNAHEVWAPGHEPPVFSCDDIGLVISCVYVEDTRVGSAALIVCPGGVGWVRRSNLVALRDAGVDKATW